MYQPAGHQFYTGSTTSGDILKVDMKTGNATLWAAGAPQNRRFATGLKFDGKNHMWVCGGDEGKMFVLDGNGSLLKMWDLKAMFGAQFVNDCICDGTHIYITDSRTQKMYRATVADMPDTIEEWLVFNNSQIPYQAGATNANGIVVTPDGKYLIVVVSSSGKLYRINKADKTVTEITLNTAVTGGDGLVLDGNTLFVCRNAQNTIVPIALNNDYTSGTVGNGFGTDLAFNTTMAKVDKYLLTVNGQLNKRATRDHKKPFTVSSVRVP